MAALVGRRRVARCRVCANRGERCARGWSFELDSVAASKLFVGEIEQQRVLGRDRDCLARSRREGLGDSKKEYALVVEGLRAPNHRSDIFGADALQI